MSHNSTSAQRQRLLERLKKSSLDTLTARKELDIMHPGGRVNELRHKYGYQIDMVYIHRVNPDSGKAHRIGMYVLTVAGTAGTAPADETPDQVNDQENKGGTSL